MRRRSRQYHIPFLSLFALVLLGLGIVLSGLDGSAQAGEEDEARVPIIMYHSVLNNAAMHGVYVLSPQQLENDFQYLQQEGYTAIFVSDLVAYIYEGKPLPDKPIILSFDDAHYNNMTYVLPLLEQYDMKAVISVVGEYTETSAEQGEHNPNFSYFTWQDITNAVATGRIEIANHSYSMHTSATRKGAAKMRGETLEAYETALRGDLLRLQNELAQRCGFRPLVFTYPFGAVSKETEEIIQRLGFRASLGCAEKVNVISQYKPDDLYGLGRFNRPSGVDTKTFMRKIK